MSKYQTIWTQIEMGVKMSLGARQPVGSDDNKDCNAYLHFTVGPCRKGLDKIVIRLNPLDTYDIELIRMKRKTYEQITLAIANNVYVENLNRVLLDMEAKLS